MKSNTRWVAAAILSIAAAGASAASDHGQHVAAGATASAASAGMTAGEVRKVDTAQGKVTIRHEAIQNLDMPPMTMVFRAKNPEQLKDLRVGDKVRFQAESVGGNLTVTEIERGS